MPKRNFYDVLGISEQASADDIRKAYRKKSLETHPDLNMTKGEGVRAQKEEEFKEVGNAYATLSDPQRRAFYDNTLKAERSPTPQPPPPSPPPPSRPPTYPTNGPPQVQLKSHTMKFLATGDTFKTSLSLSMLEKEFNQFKDIYLEKNKDKLLPIDEGFNYKKDNGPPEVGIFTFPDEDSAKQFMNTLAGKGYLTSMSVNEQQEEEQEEEVEEENEALNMLTQGEDTAEETTKESEEEIEEEIEEETPRPD